MADFGNVPLYVAGGRHYAEVLRLGPYMGFGGREGIVRADDLKVTELDTPGGSVYVNPGACGVLARGPGQSQQMYADALYERAKVSIPSTDSDGGRSDLIVARVEDPDDGTGQWDEPDTVEDGPYMFARRIPDVPSSTKSVHELESDLGTMNAITLARIDLPSSTGTVEDEHITDLREMSQPRTQTIIRSSLQHSGATDTSGIGDHEFPSKNGTYNIDVPDWAKHVDLRYDVIMLYVHDEETAGNFYGDNYIKVDGDEKLRTRWNYDWHGGWATQIMAVGGHFRVEDKQGDTMVVKHYVEIRGDSGDSKLREQEATATMLTVHFGEQ